MITDMEIKIDEEFKAVLPPLSAEELSGLEAAILEHGCRDPLVVWNGILVDGHNRLGICRKHGIKYEVVEAAFDTRAQARLFIRKNQGGRRNVSVAWKIEMELKNKKDLLEAGKDAKRKSGEATGRGNKKVLSPSDKTFTPVNTREAIAEKANVSAGQVGMAERIMTKSPELWEKVKAQETSIKAAYNEIKKEEAKQERAAKIAEQKKAIESGTVQLPPGVFEVIAIDPPWNYNTAYDPETRRGACPYPEMTQEQLLAIDLPAAQDAALFLWTTHAFIWDAKQLLDRWGFSYKATLVWDKQMMGMGQWLRMQCEFCLVGIKGKPAWNNTKWRDLISEKRREHSKKPEAFYQLVEDVTIGRRLEYFSRTARDGWEVFGDEI